ncbi:hypothetical protein BDZ97DRAFT_1053824 [Flammula alnicola]|nr:hypothetical protein BDZ97DRAFT_1053824 [Flammula alnicola]
MLVGFSPYPHLIPLLFTSLLQLVGILFRLRAPIYFGPSSFGQDKSLSETHFLLGPGRKTRVRYTMVHRRSYEDSRGRSRMGWERNWQWKEMWPRFLLLELSTHHEPPLSSLSLLANWTLMAIALYRSSFGQARQGAVTCRWTHKPTLPASFHA